MGRKEVKSAIDAANIDSVHMAWERGLAPDLPWCVFYIESTRGVFADNETIAPSINWVVELYQKQSDQELEKRLEESISERFGPFNKSEVWVEKENCIQTAYYFKEIEHG